MAVEYATALASTFLNNGPARTFGTKESRLIISPVPKSMLTEPLGYDYRSKRSFSPVYTANILRFKQTFREGVPCAPAGPRARTWLGAGSEFPLFPARSSITRQTYLEATFLRGSACLN